jgi:signal transduction histidine kinase
VFDDSILEYLAPDDRDVVRAIVQRSISTSEPFSFHYRVPIPDGGVRVIHSRGEVFCNETGTPVRLFGTAQDVTDIKHAEQQIYRSNEQLRALSARLESVREEESTRIARELHDELGSSLTSLRWDLEGLASAAGSLPDDAKLPQRVSQMLGHVDSIITAVRRLSSELRPPILDDLGIIDAIFWQLQQFQRRTGIACDYHSDLLETAIVDKKIGTACFRIQQEMLTNIIRHAQASSVSVRIHKEGGTLVFATSDNGRGISDDEQTGRASLGILGMRERAHLIGGTLQISGVPGQGTTVVLRVPLEGSGARSCCIRAE